MTIGDITIGEITLTVIRTFVLLLALKLIFPAVVVKFSVWFGCLLIIATAQGIAGSLGEVLVSAMITIAKAQEKSK